MNTRLGKLINKDIFDVSWGYSVKGIREGGTGKEKQTSAETKAKANATAGTQARSVNGNTRRKKKHPKQQQGEKKTQ